MEEFRENLPKMKEERAGNDTKRTWSAKKNFFIALAICAVGFIAGLAVAPLTIERGNQKIEEAASKSEEAENEFSKAKSECAAAWERIMELAGKSKLTSAEKDEQDKLRKSYRELENREKILWEAWRAAAQETNAEIKKQFKK